MKKTLICLIVIICMISLVFVSCSKKEATTKPEEKKYTLRVMHAYPETSQHGRNMFKFKELVEKETNGRIEVKIYPNGQLGAIDKEVGMVQSGAVEAAYAINGTLETLDPIEAIYTLPFFWKSRPGNSEQYIIATKYNSMIENYLRENAKKYGIYRLASVNTQNGQFIVANNVREVKRPEDMKGLKLRHSGGMVATLQLESFGAIAITMSGGEVPVALSQKVIDGMQSAVLHYHDSRWHTKYITANYSKCYSLPLILNLKWFESLPKDLQDILQNKVTPQLQDYANTETSNGELKALEIMQKEPYNVKVTLLSDEEIDKYWVNYNNIREEGVKLYLSKTGAEGQKLIDEVNRIGAEVAKK